MRCESERDVGAPQQTCVVVAGDVTRRSVTLRTLFIRKSNCESGPAIIADPRELHSHESVASLQLCRGKLKIRGN